MRHSARTCFVQVSVHCSPDCHSRIPSQMETYFSLPRYRCGDVRCVVDAGGNVRIKTLLATAGQPHTGDGLAHAESSRVG